MFESGASALQAMTDAIVEKTPLRIEAEKLKALLLQYNIFLSGGGGVGKSWLTKELASLYRNPVVLASTGMAANNIRGATVHSTFSLGISNNIKELKAYDDYRLKKMLSRGYNKAKAEYYLNYNLEKILASADIIIIDEISMLSSSVLDLLAHRLEQLTDRRIPILVVGDFYQLPPVKGKYAFHSRSWNFKTLELTEIKRTENREFAEIQLKLRRGEKSPLVLDYLKKLSMNKQIGEPVKLFSLNEDVNKANIAHIKSLDGKGYKVNTDYEKLKPHLPESIMESFKSELSIDETLRFRIGSRVMTVVNSENIYNGMLGTIVDVEMESKSLVMQTDDGAKINIDKYTFEKTEISEVGGRLNMDVVATANQYPIVIAAASTIHKSQGMSIGNVYIDCNRIFERGQFYVAISRAVNPDKLVLKNFNPKYIKKNTEVDEFYDNCERISL